MYTRIDHNPLCDPLLGIPWNERLTSEETTGSEFSDSVFEYPSEVCKEEKTPLEEKKPLPWVVVHAMQYADQKGGDFEVWGVRGDEARVLAYLWRLHDCLQARKTVVAAVEIIANWLGKCRQTVAKILRSLVSEGLISWAFGGAWSYRSKLAREVKWVGIGEADEPQERPCVDDRDPTDWHTLNIIRRLVCEFKTGENDDRMERGSSGDSRTDSMADRPPWKRSQQPEPGQNTGHEIGSTSGQHVKENDRPPVLQHSQGNPAPSHQCCNQPRY